MSETFCESERHKKDDDGNPKPITSTKRNRFFLGSKKKMTTFDEETALDWNVELV